MRVLRLTIVVLMLTCPIPRAFAQAGAGDLANADAMLAAGEWAEAESLYADAWDGAATAERSGVAFKRAFAAYKQGEELTRQNLDGDGATARAALAHFERALDVLSESDDPRRNDLEEALTAFIARERSLLERLFGG